MDELDLRLLQLAGQGYHCSQIIILLGLEARGEDNPGLVRALAGLAYGCGGGRGACGALSGAACLIGLHAGKGAAEEQEDERLLMMLQELGDWFAQRLGPECPAVTCEAILGDDTPAAARRKCGSLVAETYAKAVEILAANGFGGY
ncbi:MAG: C-GCAxxG-C-C family protein [Pseudomonadota bacterium]